MSDNTKLDTGRAKAEEYLKNKGIGNGKWYTQTPEGIMPKSTADLLAEFSNQQNKNLLEQNQWISVEGRLPEHLKPVMMYGMASEGMQIHTTHCGVLHRAGDLYEWLSLGYKIHKVTHWKPLPEPPKE